MEMPEIFDVTVIDPHLKYLALFEKLDAIKQGSSFLMLDDRDPQPLHDRLLAERGQIFRWELLESLPRMWRVKITRRSEDIAEETIGQIVSRDYRKAKIFKNLGIDFSCGGNKTIK